MIDDHMLLSRQRDVDHCDGTKSKQSGMLTVAIRPCGRWKPCCSVPYEVLYGYQLD